MWWIWSNLWWVWTVVATSAAVVVLGGTSIYDVHTISAKCDSPSPCPHASISGWTPSPRLCGCHKWMDGLLDLHYFVNQLVFFVMWISVISTYNKICHRQNIFVNITFFGSCWFILLHGIVVVLLTLISWSLHIVIFTGMDSSDNTRHHQAEKTGSTAVTQWCLYVWDAF